MRDVVYSAGLVERFIRNYFDVRSMLAGGKAVPSHDSSHTVTLPVKAAESSVERPLGYDGRPWPFEGVQHAQPPRDGKTKSRKVEDMLCMCLDFEAATFVMPDNDLYILYSYHVFQTHTLDELAQELGLKSRGSLLARIRRAVARLALEMEYADRAAKVRERAR